MKPERLSADEWYTHWYGTQTPMSTEIQPRIRYVRNAVARPLTPGAPAYQGIVEEAWPSAEHIVDPMLFFNGFGHVAIYLGDGKMVEAANPHAGTRISPVDNAHLVGIRRIVVSTYQATSGKGQAAVEDLLADLLRDRGPKAVAGSGESATA